MKRQLLVLQATTASTEERFQDAKARHERELEKLAQAHQKELAAVQQQMRQLRHEMTMEKDRWEESQEDKQFDMEQMEERYAAKEKLLESRYHLLEERMLDAERESQQTQLLLQSQIQHLEERLLQQEAAATITAERSQKKVDDAATSFVAAEKYAERIRELERTLESLHAEKDQAVEQARQVVMADLEQMENELSDERQRNQAMLLELDGHRADKAVLQEERDRLLQTDADMQTQVDSLVVQIADLERGEEEYRSRCQEAELTVTELRDQNQLLERQITEKEQEVKETVQLLESELDQAREEKLHADQEAKRTITELQSVLKELRHQYGVLQSNAASRRNSVDFHEIETDLAATKRDRDELEAFIVELNQLFLNTEQERNGLKQKVVELEKQAVESVAVDSQRADEADEELMSFIEQMSEKVNQYREDMTLLKQENEKLKATVQAMTTNVQSSTSSSSAPSSSSPEVVSADALAREEIPRKDLEAVLAREHVLQEEMDGLLRELDRLSYSMSDMESERHKLQQSSQQYRDQIKSLQEQLHELMAKNLGTSTSTATTTAVDSEPITIQNMRKEFRRQLQTVRNDYGDQIEREMQERFQLEKDIRSMRRDREMKAYNKMTRSAQTLDSYTKM